MPGAFSDQIASYPAAAKKFWHLLGVKASSATRMASHKSEIVRSAAARRSPLASSQRIAVPWSRAKSHFAANSGLRRRSS